MKRHDEDLNTTLIFVRRGQCLGAHTLTRVAGRPVLRHDLRVCRRCPAQLRQDPNEETAALLRILL